MGYDLRVAANISPECSGSRQPPPDPPENNPPEKISRRMLEFPLFGIRRFSLRTVLVFGGGFVSSPKVIDPATPAESRGHVTDPLSGGEFFQPMIARDATGQSVLTWPRSHGDRLHSE